MTAVAPDVAEPEVVRHHLAVAPKATADIQGVVRRAAEDVVPEEHVDSVPLVIFLPRIRPELGVFDQVVEDLGADVAATRLKLLAKIVTTLRLAIFLPLGQEGADLSAVMVEVVASAFELHDTRLRRAYPFRVVKRELAGRGQVNEVVDRQDLVRATEDAEEGRHLILAVREGSEVLRLEADLRSSNRKLVGDANADFGRVCHLAHPFVRHIRQGRIKFMLEDDGTSP